MKRPTDLPSTAFMLAMRYQSQHIPLADVIKQYMPHLTYDYAHRRATEQSLPFPVFRSDPNSKKSAYLVRVSDLALWLDSVAEQAARDWENVNE